MMSNDQLQIVIETVESRMGSVAYAPQKVRIKKYAPKTRSGCLTCRMRRIKCDETRPHCERCVKARRYCYYRGTQETMSAPRSLHTGLRPAYGDNEAERYLDIFLNLVVPRLSSYTSGDLLSKTLPQFSWHAQALRHVIISIGIAAERRYNLSNRYTVSGRAVWHYNEALRLTYQGQPSTDLILSTCFLFWLYDNIAGQTRTALIHLQGLLHLASSLSQTGILTEFQVSILQNIFWCGHGTNKDLTDQIYRNITEQIVQRLNRDDYHIHLMNRSAVAREGALGWAIYNYVASGESLPRAHSQQPTYQDLPASNLLQCFVQMWYDNTKAWCLFLSDDDLLSVNCHYKLLIALTKSSQPVANRTKDLGEVLQSLRNISIGGIDQQLGRADLIMPLIPVLTELVKASFDSQVGLEAFALLSRLQRVEGCWSSDIVVAMLQHMLSTNQAERHVLRPESLSTTIQDLA